MTRNNKYLFSLLLLTVVLILIFSFRSFLGQYVLTPLTLLAQTAWQMISSVHQNVYWTVLVIFCFLLAKFIIPSNKEKQPSSAYRYDYKPPDQYIIWRKNFEDSALGEKEKEFLRQSLYDLYITLVSNQGKDTLPVEQLSMPPAVKQYLFNPQKEKNLLLRLMPWWLRKQTSKYFYRDNTSIDDLLKWMEKELEINDEK